MIFAFLRSDRSHCLCLRLLAMSVFLFHVASCGQAPDLRSKAHAQLQATDAENTDKVVENLGDEGTMASDPLSTQTPAGAASALAYFPLFQCNAYPINGMPFVYWIHANAAIAARSAMNACWHTYYVPCRYNCFRIR